MKGCCGHITNLSVVSDFEILIFCLFIYFLVCLYLVLCWFCKRKMVQSFWRKITFCIFVKKIHCQHQQGLGSQKYFWCLDLEIFKFISQTIFTKLCMLFLIVCKKMPSVMNIEQGPYRQWAFSSTLCIKETEDILEVEYGS